MMAFLLYTFIVIFIYERTDNYMNTKSINDKISQYPIFNEVNLSLKLKNVSKRTILNYMDGISRFLDFISYDNQFEITSDMFRDYLIYLHSTSLKKNSINSNNSYIRFFFFSVLDKPLNLYKVPMARFARKEIDSFLIFRFVLFFLPVLLILEWIASSSLDCAVVFALTKLFSLKFLIFAPGTNQICAFISVNQKETNLVMFPWTIPFIVLSKNMLRNIVFDLVPIDSSSLFIMAIKPATKLSEDTSIITVVLLKSPTPTLFTA